MADAFDDEVEGEPTISIKDYLEAVEEEELLCIFIFVVFRPITGEFGPVLRPYFISLGDPEADLVLGGDEGKECTYSKGYMKRQAIFSCLTCTPDGNAGFALLVACLAMMAMRCDCGNSKFGGSFCKLLASKDVENANNVYNHNFKGTYCTCDLPYPDPNAEEQVEMIQCCICEDWFHEEHIGLQSSDKIPRDESGEPLYEDFICQGCAVVCSFLTYYPQTISSPDPSSSSKEKAVLETEPPVISSGKLENKSDSTLSNANSVAVLAEAKPTVDVKECSEVAGPSTKCIIGIDLFGNPRTIDSSKPIFLSKNWREVLCRCENCSNFYAQKGIGFLLDKEDSIAEYERVAKQKRNENLQKQEGVELNFLNNLGHVAKMEILSGIADMKNEFCAFLESTDPSKPITTADVQQVFDNLAKKRKRTL
ncbi:UNVERIFIED_CONTAM: putative E3 ubiquitin-protein ligase UBR7 [Sesamum radiatum]|uniref:E3 ubiquitin-protein ligase UBR7 n=1 Tax=Sesamum radiatum TaxID=300843 RepID=A0AAW2MEY6_SESRA